MAQSIKKEKEFKLHPSDIHINMHEPHTVQLIFRPDEYEQYGDPAESRGALARWKEQLRKAKKMVGHGWKWQSIPSKKELLATLVSQDTEFKQMPYILVEVPNNTRVSQDNLHITITENPSSFPPCQVQSSNGRVYDSIQCRKTL